MEASSYTTLGPWNLDRRGAKGGGGISKQTKIIMINYGA